MTLDEVYKLAEKEYNHKLNETCLVNTEDEFSDYVSLMVLLKLFLNEDPRSNGAQYYSMRIESIPTVKNFKINNDGLCEIHTDYGNRFFYPFRQFFNEEISCNFEMGLCYNNSVALACILHSQNPSFRPEVVGGILSEVVIDGDYTCYLDPYLHSVCSFMTKHGKVIADFTNNVVMSEDLYLKLYNFEVLSKISMNEIVEAAPIRQSFIELSEKQKLSWEQTGTLRDFVFAFDEYFKYMKKILSGSKEYGKFFVQDGIEYYNLEQKDKT